MNPDGLALAHVGRRGHDVEARARPLPSGRRLSRARRNPDLRRKQRAAEKKDRAITECDLRSKCGPEPADDKTGNEIADSVRRGEDTERHAVMTFTDELGAKRILERFFHGDINSTRNKNERHRPCRCWQKNNSERHQSSERITSRKQNIFRKMIAEPPRNQGKTRVKNVVQNVKTDRDAGCFCGANGGSKFLRGEQNQHAVRKISRAEQADGNEKLSIGRREQTQSFTERNVRNGSALAFFYEKRNDRGREQSRHERPKKKQPVIVTR